MSNTATTIGAPGSPAVIAARIERLPLSPWHARMRLIIGTAWFFDAFDALAIAVVLPALIPLWKLAPAQIGLLIGIGYLGQMIGSIISGWAGERFGRTPLLLVNLIIFTVGSFGCAAAWDYPSLLGMRFLQGLGLGGEIPIMIAYMNEFAKAEGRGRFALAYQALCPVGILACSLVATWVVPNLGWRWMFIIGGIPALVAIPLRMFLIESPRWLASRGRQADADAAMSRIEAIVSEDGRVPLPPLPTDIPPANPARTRLGDLFKGIYLRRTLSLWGLWITSYIVIYGLGGWFISIMRTVYKLSQAQSLWYGVVLNLLTLLGTLLCVFLVDRVGRKRLFTGAFALGSLPLLALAVTGSNDPQVVVALASMGACCLGVLAVGLGTFTAENYPNHMRALGGGIANAWLRGASVVTPTFIGYLLVAEGVGAVWGLFGGAALLGAIICAVFSIETSGRTLEEISPAP